MEKIRGYFDSCYSEQDLDSQLRAPRLLTISLLIVPVMITGAVLDFNLSNYLSGSLEVLGALVAVAMVLLIYRGAFSIAVPMMLFFSLGLIMFLAFPFRFHELTTRDIALYLSLPVVFTAIVDRRPWMTLVTTGLSLIYLTLVFFLRIQPGLSAEAYAAVPIFIMSEVMLLLLSLGIHQVLIITAAIARKRESAIANVRLRQKELEQRNLDLERLNRFFFHELKGPLITIQTYSGSMKSDLEKGRVERAFADLDRIIASGSFLARAQARLIQLNHLALHDQIFKNVDLQEIWTRSLKIMELSSSQVVATQVLPTLWGESRSFELIFQEVLDNSRKFFPGPLQDLRIKITVKSSPGLIVLEITDNGPGMEESKRATALEPFERFSGTSTGLGLTLASRAASRMGFTLEVFEPGTGCGIRLVCPVQEKI